MTLQLANRSIKYPRGIVEDVLVQVDKLIVPADFVVVDMKMTPNRDSELPILLGCPFMATTKTIIDMQNGKLKMTMLDQTIEFSIFKSLSLLSETNECFLVDSWIILFFLVFCRIRHKINWCLL